MQEPEQKNSLHKYTLGEELISSISHGFGALFAIIGTIILLYHSAVLSDSRKIVSSAIYGFSMIVLYIISTVYHSLARNRGKKVLRILDHCIIYILITGTYTPYCLVTLNGWLGFAMLGVLIAATIVGVTLSAIDFKKYGKFAMVCYLAMGWVAVFGIVKIYELLSFWGFFLLLLGGVFYTVGAILYGLGKRKKYIHSVWHFFVLAGTILQYFSILYYVII